MWNIKNRQMVQDRKYEIASLRGLQLSHNGQWILSSHGGTVHLFDLMGDELKKFLSDDLWRIRARFSSDDRLLTVCNGNDLEIWDVHDLVIIKRLRHSDGSLVDIMFTSDEKFLATASVNGTISLWELEKITACE